VFVLVLVQCHKRVRGSVCVFLSLLMCNDIGRKGGGVSSDLCEGVDPSIDGDSHVREVTTQIMHHL
jgi:hypothetical protein